MSFLSENPNEKVKQAIKFLDDEILSKNVNPDDMDLFILTHIFDHFKFEKKGKMDKALVKIISSHCKEVIEVLSFSAIFLYFQ